MNQPQRPRFARRQPLSRPAFTIVELLVTVAIIILLLSVLLIAMNAATNASKKSNTLWLMDSISKGLIRFREDIGYYPPILGVAPGTVAPVNDHRKLHETPDPDDPVAINAWYSATTLADYLVGWDIGTNDGFGSGTGWAATNEIPPTGIRHPGNSDGVWGALDNPSPSGAPSGSLAARNPPTSGRVFGPYLELKDRNLLGSINGTFDYFQSFNVFFPGDVGYNASNPHVIADYWGKPIRYYRRPYPRGAITQAYRPVERDDDPTTTYQVPTLSDFYFLRPYSVKPGAEANARFKDVNGDETTSRDLDAAEFALFSSGPDRAVNYAVRVDFPGSPTPLSTEHVNADNIIVTGP